jgi:hypothetical protein
MAAPVLTGKKAGKASPPVENQFKPGHPSANPAGRPKGSRNKLGEAFIEALHADFMDHGPTVIEAVRVEKPDQYLKVIASILPKQLEIKNDAFEGMSDDELAALVAAARSALGIAEGERGDAPTAH